MKTTLMQTPCVAALLPVPAGAQRAVAPTAAPVRGTTASAAARVRHSGTDALTFDAVGTAVDAAPPPRGAPV